MIISCENLSKKFCRDLKRSLWYGVQDVAQEFSPFSLKRKKSSSNDSVLRKSEFWALKDVGFELKRGESLGLVGRNGAGKTTMLKLLSGLIKPDSGSARLKGRVGALIALGAGFNPVLTGRENIRINAGILGFSKKEIDEKMEEILDFASIPDEALDAPVRTYSSGMQARLGFSVAANLEPDILLVDEVLAVGDTSFRRKCDGLMDRFRKNGGSLILVSHNSYHVSSICTKGMWVRDGSVQASGNASTVIKQYLEEALVAGVSNANPESNTDSLINFVEVRALSSGQEKAYAGTDISFEIDYESKETFEDVKIGVNFFTSTGDIRLGTAISNDVIGTKILNIEKGRGTVKFSLKNCPFAPGNYQIRGGIVGRENEKTIATYGWENAPLYFEVYPNGLRSGLATEWGEVVLLNPTAFSINI